MSPAPCVIKWKRIYADMLEEGAPVSLKQLDVRGDELIKAGIKPEEVGKVLETLLYDCALDGRLNVNKTLLERAKRLTIG